MTGIIIFWHFFFAVVGLLVGILIGRQIERRAKPPVPTQVSIQTPAPVPVHTPAREGDHEILLAGRNGAGKIWLELDGTRLEDKASLKSDQQRNLLNLMLELRPWLETDQSAQPAPAARPAPAKKISPPEKKETPVAPAMKSIIEQINDVLQARLAGSIFEDRGIQLVEGQDGSVIVEEGLNKYEGIEAVPDAEIKTFIRQAVSDWEKTAK